MMRKAWALVEECRMISPGEKVLAAVSGGGDSMCLLHLLWQAAEKRKFSVEAATFDHQIRAESAEDAAFVRDWCQERGIPCHVGRGDVPRWAKEHGMGLEEAARELRYDFLQAAAQSAGAEKIATAHNADDNAETILLHLMRGSGLRGMGGIPPVRGNLIRPLLTTSRAEIDQYLKQWSIPHVEDATNADLTYSRNYLRHEIIPRLKTQNPNLLERLSRSAKSFRQDNDFLEERAAEIAAQAVLAKEEISFPVERMIRLPEALSNRVVQRLAERLDDSIVLSAVHREAVVALCQSGSPSGEWALPGSLTARRVYGCLVLSRGKEAGTFAPVYLQPGEKTRIGNRELACEMAACPGGKFNQPDEFYLKATGGLLLRPRRTGDEITLPGRDRKTVKKLLIDSKIPRDCRERMVVFEIGGRLAGLDGFGADRAFLPEPGEWCWKITGRTIKM